MQRFSHHGLRVRRVCVTPSPVSDLRRASQGSALRKTSGIRIDRRAA
jgi:hypothetical protein